MFQLVGTERSQVTAVNGLMQYLTGTEGIYVTAEIEWVTITHDWGRRDSGNDWDKVGYCNTWL